MVNPSFPQNQLTGVSNLETARMYAYLYQNTYVTYSILHSLDGYDEVSLTGPTKIIKNKSEGLFNPSDLGLSTLNKSDIMGGSTVEESATIFQNIISGNGTQAQQDVVCANAAIAISTANNCLEIEAFEMAKESLLSGKALQSLTDLIILSN